MSISPQFTCPKQIGIYLLEQVIGSGAFACVYLAVCKGEQFALKIITKSLITKPDDQIRLQREIDSTSLLRHPNIVGLHDFFQDDLYYYLVLDYCPGGNLACYLEKNPKLREVQAAHIFKQMVSAINYCHQHGVAHRDLKPANILITHFPDIKIGDFGLCGYIHDDVKMKTFCGSPCYTAPECLSEIQYDGHLSDVWSLGVILFEMTTGTYPWHINNIPKMVQEITKAQYKIPNDISPALTDLIHGILRVRPSDRLKCDEILNMPWMRLGVTRDRSVSSKSTSILPPLSCTVEDFTRTLDRDGKGIKSPFLQKTESPGNSFRSRSGSFSKTLNVSALQRGQFRVVDPRKPHHIPIPPSTKSSDFNSARNFYHK